MMNVWLLPIEGHEQRYTDQWRQHLRMQIEHAAADRGVTTRVIEVDGDMPEQMPTEGAFLDFAGTNVFKSTQIARVAEHFQRKEVQPGDVFVFTDAWHPGVHQVRYMSALRKVPVRIVGLWHAGHYDPEDFLGRIPLKYAPWAEAMERALFAAYDVSAFATQAHIDMFREALKVSKDDMRVAKVGWPMEYLADELQPFLGVPKENIVLFPHRRAPEKQESMFKEVGREFPDWQFVVAQETKRSKADYHDLLARSRVVFSCSLQETLGIGCYEGVLAGAVPVVPQRLSYQEMYPKEFQYPSEWTMPDTYQQNKSALVAHLRKILARISEGGFDLEPCRRQLAPFFSGEALYDQILAEFSARSS
ncbi:hypothetical protein MCBMB27_05611 [Methylobacterium phyllosphaerae]|uniref:Glycosyltransferase involved in cell wall bisynthesis n=1 Tax=Methylobacterium phyllosphaerae TaxID=418223 RepID=A0AAE8HVA7_9HYPH|nr:hypothetical protein [Methylobacterium phyllosphaerae]APT34902.1 hypothetical protein MCBMB27_05611 [Methylobacterium phyllosphaerae]SFH36303.1 Glycosyltransferase involved in cell wall bisynthesis [Methylobacterium phyllosphaerae]